MPTLIHIADEKSANKILKNGIKIGKHSNGIFFMPVTQDFFGSHQWIRELKRRGIKTFVGVYFKLKSEETVWYGKYNNKHLKGPLGIGIRNFLDETDRLGYEFLIERKIEASEIHKIRSIPQNVGWRYSPHSHKRPLNCTCPMCISYGEINSRKKINKIEPPQPLIPYGQIIEKLKVEKDEYKIDDLFSLIRRKKRKTDPEELRFIIENGEIGNIQSLAITLSSYKHPNAKNMLIELCKHKDEDVREFSAEGLIEAYKERGIELLMSLSYDPIIERILNENRADNKL